jgi:hypothetical protein
MILWDRESKRLSKAGSFNLLCALWAKIDNGMNISNVDIKRPRGIPFLMLGTLLEKRRRTINRISILAVLFAVSRLHAGYRVSVEGNYSIVTAGVPVSARASYSANEPDYRFTDYGGHIYQISGDWSYGLTMALYSGFNNRDLLTATSTVSQRFIERKNAESAATYLFSGGNYRYGLGWVPLQLHLRRSLVTNWLFADLGAGPAYGFGASEYLVRGTAGATEVSETIYHRYSEWGLIASLALGAELKLAKGISVDIQLEGAWLHATVRSPDLSANTTVQLSQFFVRPGVALAFHF